MRERAGRRGPRLQRSGRVRERGLHGGCEWRRGSWRGVGDWRRECHRGGDGAERRGRGAELRVERRVGGRGRVRDGDGGGFRGCCGRGKNWCGEVVWLLRDFGALRRENGFGRDCRRCFGGRRRGLHRCGCPGGRGGGRGWGGRARDDDRRGGREGDEVELCGENRGGEGGGGGVVVGWQWGRRGRGGGRIGRIGRIGGWRFWGHEIRESAAGCGEQGRGSGRARRGSGLGPTRAAGGRRFHRRGGRLGRRLSVGAVGFGFSFGARGFVRTVPKGGAGIVAHGGGGFGASVRRWFRELGARRGRG